MEHLTGWHEKMKTKVSRRSKRPYILRILYLEKRWLVCPIPPVSLSLSLSR